MTINIFRFTAFDNDPRDYLHKPWVEEGRTVATNGHICLSVDEVLTGDVMPAPSDTMKGRIPKVIAGAASLQARLQLADVAFKKVPCSYCTGSGFAQIRTCEDCDGDGEFERGRHWYHCKACNGEGVHATPCTSDTEGAKRCWNCQGTGHARNSYTNVGPTTIANRYLALMKELPNCRLALPDHPHSPVRFDFEGGTGVVMPIRA